MRRWSRCTSRKASRSAGSARWEDEGLYRAGAGKRRDETFVICVPPPNVTGALHMGHALNGSIQDLLIRWHRMQGYDTLWQPGYDHAGIATQNVVEKQLVQEGTSRKELGREAFVERVWRHLDATGKTIMGQFRRLGASLDYERERFTMDDAYIEAVMRFFVHLWDRGWIYRANRIVNWCPFHETAISDLEVEHVDMDDTLTYARYPFVDGSGHLTIATVRPATMLADVAVAVHPDDERYRDAVGKQVLVPYVERAVPVIADERVEPEFGTGALKVTPGHDPMDFEIGRDHELPTITVIGLDGRMNENAGDLAGKTQAEADEAILAWLKEHDRLEKREHYRHAVGTCERCHTRIEPLVSLQWWVRDGGAAQAGAAGVARAARPLPPRVAAPVRDPLARGDPGLEHLPPALVGAPAAALVLPGRPRHVRLAAARRVRRMRLDRDRARSRRARHVVLVGALAVRDARLARADTRARALLPRRRQLDRARDHPPLGEPDDLDGARADGGDPVHRRDHPLDDPAPPTAAGCRRASATASTRST